jgi:hypothetical protein
MIANPSPIRGGRVRPFATVGFATATFLCASAQGQTDLSWNTVDCGGGAAAGGAIAVSGTIGQPDAGGPLSGGSYTVTGGFWTASASCYANCDNSTVAPVLNVLDFSCFLNKFAAGDPYANCDGSTTAPVLNVLDFACFLNKFAAGCP